MSEASEPAWRPGGEAGDPPDPVVELVRRVAAGDGAAEAQLVERFSRPVSLLLRHLTRGAAMAEDLHQETFRLVIEKVRRGELREPGKLPGFVSNMARNLFIAAVRVGSRRRRWHAEPESGETAPDPAPGQLSRLLAHDRARIVRRVLAELDNERDREILTRYYIADQEKDVICRDLRLSSLHFNRVLFRARQRYRELFERREGGWLPTPAPAAAGEPGR